MTGEKVPKISIPEIQVYPLATKWVLWFCREPSTLKFDLYTHLRPIVSFRMVSLLTNLWISFL